jgi:hypothetical protein
LIGAADLGIVLISSLVGELLIERKPFVYPKALHPHRMVFDEHRGCVTAGRLDEVHRWLPRFASGGVPPLDDAAGAAVEREVVQGGREPYDVPEDYDAQARAHLDAAERVALAARGTGAHRG